MAKDKLRRLTEGFRQSGVARGQEGKAIRDTLAAVQNLTRTRGISAKQAVAVLRTTAKQISAGTSRLGKLATQTGGAPTTVRGLTKALTIGGGEARGKPVGADVASFIANREMRSPSTSIRVFGSRRELSRRRRALRGTSGVTRRRR